MKEYIRQNEYTEEGISRTESEYLDKVSARIGLISCSLGMAGKGILGEGEGETIFKGVRKKKWQVLGIVENSTYL